MTHEPDSTIDFGATPYTTFSTGSGDTNTDALLRGRKWTDPALTYSFPDFSGDYGASYPDSESSTPNVLDTFSAFSSEQEQAAVYWLGRYAEFSGLSFVELDGSPGALNEDQEATLRFANSQDPSTAYAYYPGSNANAGDLWFGDSGDHPHLGNYDWHTVGHEIGHAFGLKHGHDSGGISGDMNADRDSMEFSIMTYRSYVGGPDDGYSNGSTSYAQTPMMYDIAAIQFMYGANFNAHAENTTYTFSTATGEMFKNGIGLGVPVGNKVFRTMWDGNGIDTYDFSNYTTPLAIDLAPGGWVDLDTGGNFQRAYLGDGHYARGHVFNALQHNGDARSLIENANGGAGNDTIHGNQAHNTLVGNNGEDLLYGKEGNDRLLGGDADDALAGGAGNDILDGGFGFDFLDGGTGVDTADYRFYNGSTAVDLSSGRVTFPGNSAEVETIVNVENVWTGNGDDTVIGNGAVNSIRGNGGNDTLRGGHADDLLYGGAGNDTLDGGFGFDFLDGGTGEDTADYTFYDGPTSVDLSTGRVTFPGNSTSVETIANVENLRMGDGADTVIGNGEVNRIWGNGGNDTLRGGHEDDFLYGGAGNDTLDGGFGFDFLDGGAGIDTADYTFYGGPTSVDLSSGRVTFPGNSTEVETLTNVENVSTGSGADTVIGDAGVNSILTGAGNDRLDGGGGADFLLGGVGDDSYHVNDSFDLVDEGGAFPAHRGSASDFDTILSTANWFWDVYSVGERMVIEDGAAGSGAGGAGTTIVSSIFSNELHGNDGTNIMFGRGGADTYRAGDGTDYISLSLLGLTEDNAYVGVDGVNTIIVDARETGAFSYDIVFEYESGKDRVDVSDYGYASGADVLALGVNDGFGNSYYALGDGFDYLHMVGLTTSEISAGDFIV